MSEYGDAIASLVAAVRDVDKAAARSDKIRSERDDALATIARVQAILDSDVPALIVDRVREALDAAQGEAQGAAGATNGRKGTRGGRDDSVALQSESEPATNPTKGDTP